MREDLFEAFIQGASEGETKLSINQESAEDQVEVMRRDEDTDTEISGQVIDRNTKRGIPEILVIAIRAKTWHIHQAARIGAAGLHFQNSSLKVKLWIGCVARGYKDMAIDGALRISPQAPEKALIYPIPMMAA